MRIVKTIGRLLSQILTALMACILLSNVYIMIARNVTGELQPTVFGFASAVVLSGSMEDAIHVNDMVITHAQKEYAVDDVIMFESGASLTTHRIVGVSEEGFITKGDANNTEDLEPVPSERIVGKVVLVIPKIGAVIEWISTPLGMMLLVCIAFVLIEAPHWGKKQKASQES